VVCPGFGALGRKRGRHAATHSSNRSPPHPGNGISDRRDRGEMTFILRAKTTYRDAPAYKQPPFRGQKATNKIGILKTGWGGHRGLNSAPID
jgi:hypothetical protein